MSSLVIARDMLKVPIIIFYCDSIIGLYRVLESWVLELHSSDDDFCSFRSNRTCLLCSSFWTLKIFHAILNGTTLASFSISCCSNSFLFRWKFIFIKSLFFFFVEYFFKNNKKKTIFENKNKIFISTTKRRFKLFE